MWGGTRRLLLLQLGSPLRTIDRSLPIAAKLAIARTERMSAADVYRECASAAVDHLLMAAGGPVWDQADFSKLLATVKADFARAATDAAAVVGDVAALLAAIEDRLLSKLDESVDDTGGDMQDPPRRPLPRYRIPEIGKAAGW